MNTTRCFGLACILTAAMSAACVAPTAEDNAESESAKIVANINAAPVLTAKVANGYTIATSLQVGNVALPYLLLYNGTTGEAVFEYLAPDGRTLQQVGYHAWAKGWTNINAFAGYDGHAYVLFYNVSNGMAYIEQVNAAVTGLTYVWSGTLDKGWTTLATYQDPSSGAPKLIAYSAGVDTTQGAPNVHIYDINQGYNGTTTRFSGTWPGYIKNIVPYRVGIAQRVFATQDLAPRYNPLTFLYGVTWANDSFFEIGRQEGFDPLAIASYWSDNGVPRISSVDPSGNVTIAQITTHGFLADPLVPEPSWHGALQGVMHSGSNVYQFSYGGLGTESFVTFHLLSTLS